MMARYKLPILCLVLQYLTSDVKGIISYYMDVNCDRLLSTQSSGRSAFQVSLTEYTYYRRGMSCRMVLQARPGHRLMFRFSSLDIKFTRYSIFGKTNSRCVDYVEIHDGSSESSPFIDGLDSGLCGRSRGDNTVYNSTGEDITIHFYSSHTYQTTDNTGFTLVFTEFHTGRCLSDEYVCPNSRRCISQSDTCNSHNPCGDFTDCQKTTTEEPNKNGLDSPTVIGVIVSVGFLLILLILVIAVVRRRAIPSSRQRCRQRNSISFISSADITQLRLPTYEEVTGGAVGPYETTPPPPYTEEDPNKSTELGPTETNSSS